MVLNVALVMALVTARVLVITMEGVKVLDLVVAIFTTLGVAMARAGLMALAVAQGAGNGITRTSRANLEAYS